MRLWLLTGLSFCILCAPASAQEDANLFDMLLDEITESTLEELTRLPETVEVEKVETQQDVPAVTLPLEALAPYESAGSYTTIIGGSLGKAVWKDHEREDITEKLKTLPATHSLPGLAQFQKRLLLTQADIGDLDGPKEIEAGQDLFTLRLEKLIDHGWYDEAYKLYTDTVQNPPHAQLAKIGILLILYNGDLPTACLEEKVIGADYTHTMFFRKLDAVCGLELGTSDNKTLLQDNETILNIYEEDTFMIPALDTQRLSDLTPLERGLVFSKGRIQYNDNLFSEEIIRDIPPHLLMLYVRDDRLPDSLKTSFLREALIRGLLTGPQFRKRDETYKDIQALQDPEERAEKLATYLSTESSLPVLAAFAPLLQAMTPDQTTQDVTLKYAAAMLYAHKALPETWQSHIKTYALTNPKNYVYFQIVSAIAENGSFLEKNKVLPFELTEADLPQNMAQLLAILESLGAKKGLDEKVLMVYEKQSDLTEPSDYGMQTDSLENDIKTAAQEERTGLTVLNVLKALDGDKTNTPPSLIRVALSSLQNVGYIDDARGIAQKTIVDIITNDKGE